jgi:ABC-type Mn2+/Zn2+ transport system permease subunit
VPEVISRTVELVGDLFLDGFFAIMALALVAPYLGTFLVLRRMPMLGLAIPQMAGCGQAATFFLFARFVAALEPGNPEPPPEILQVMGAGAGVLAGLLVLAISFGQPRFLGVNAAIVFLAAIGLQEVFFLESPYHEAFDESLHHGRLLTVLAEGRTRVVLTCALLLSAVIPLRRPLWLSAFDPDQARLMGYSPGTWLVATLVLLGSLSALCVPVVGPETVLALLIIPPAILRGASPSLGLYGPLAVLAGVLGAAGSFIVAVALDWPSNPAVVLSVLAASMVVAAVVRAAAVVGRRLSRHGDGP